MHALTPAFDSLGSMFASLHRGERVVVRDDRHWVSFEIMLEFIHSPDASESFTVGHIIVLLCSVEFCTDVGDGTVDYSVLIVLVLLCQHCSDCVVRCVRFNDEGAVEVWVSQDRSSRQQFLDAFECDEVYWRPMPSDVLIWNSISREISQGCHFIGKVLDVTSQVSSHTKEGAELLLVDWGYHVLNGGHFLGVSPFPLPVDNMAQEVKFGYCKLALVKTKSNVAFLQAF